MSYQTFVAFLNGQNRLKNKKVGGLSFHTKIKSIGSSTNIHFGYYVAYRHDQHSVWGDI